METPIKFEACHTSSDAEYLRSQYNAFTGKTAQKKKGTLKNPLLTPFLLTIPVIIMLFTLISGSASEIQNTDRSEMLQREAVTIERSDVQFNGVAVNTDSLINSGKAVALPAKK